MSTLYDIIFNMLYEEVIEMSHISEHYHVCRKHLNKEVGVITKQGEEYFGTIVKVNKTHVYLQVHPTISGSQARTSAFGIIPLVLFDLLAIFLVSTPFFN
jgi:hypothetical protein